MIPARSAQALRGLGRALALDLGDEGGRLAPLDLESDPGEHGWELRDRLAVLVAVVFGQVLPRQQFRMALDDGVLGHPESPAVGFEVLAPACVLNLCEFLDLVISEREAG